jgi:hypothetical protein
MTTKDKREKTGFADFGCNPGDFQGMFNMMNKCCSGRDVQKKGVNNGYVKQFF